MDTIQDNVKNRDRLIQEARERLNWYNFQASEDEFNVKEVDTLVNLLSILDSPDMSSVPDAGTALEQFRQYRAEKAADAEKLASLRNDRVAAGEAADLRNGRVAAEEAADLRNGRVDAGKAVGLRKDRTDVEIADMAMPEAEPGRKAVPNMRTAKTKGGVLAFVGRHKAAAVAAAVLTVMVAAGGTMGAVSAEKNQGFFHWLEKDDSGSRLVISPQSKELDLESGEVWTYHSEDDVPDEYKKYVINIEKMQFFNEDGSGYELEEIEISDHGKSMQIVYKISDEKGVQIILGAFIYKEAVMLKRETYIDYNYMYSVNVEGVDFDLFRREDSMKQEDYAVSFYADEKQYFVNGKQSLELLERIAAEYAESVLED